MKDLGLPMRGPVVTEATSLSLKRARRVPMPDITILIIFLAMVLTPCMVGLHIYTTDRPIDESDEMLKGATTTRN